MHGVGGQRHGRQVFGGGGAVPPPKMRRLVEGADAGQLVAAFDDDDVHVGDGQQVGDGEGPVVELAGDDGDADRLFGEVFELAVADFDEGGVVNIFVDVVEHFAVRDHIGVGAQQ